MLTVIQRCGSGVNLNVHFHTLVLDGVFAELTPGRLHFHAAPPPRDAAVTQVLATIRRRVRRLLGRRGLDPAEGDPDAADGLAEASPVMARLVSASVQGRVALSPRVGARVWRLGGEPDAPALMARGPQQAHLEGFDLHANVWVPPNDRARLEHRCRYLLRPPLAQDRLRLRADGRVVVRLKKAWRDGTTRLVFEPLEFLAKLAALTPRPAINLLCDHGVLAPHARWAALMRRAFGLDVLACPRCGARMRVRATVEDPVEVRRILASLGLPRPAAQLRPGPPTEVPASPA